jgi:hypothetical protein
MHDKNYYIKEKLKKAKQKKKQTSCKKLAFAR